MSVHVLMASFKKVLCITASLLHLQTIAQSMKMQKKKNCGELRYKNTENYLILQQHTHEPRLTVPAPDWMHPLFSQEFPAQLTGPPME